MPQRGRPITQVRNKRGRAFAPAEGWRRVRQVLAPVLAAVLAGYFLYNTVQGERGLRAVAQLDRQVADSQAQLAELRAQRARWEHQVGLLRDSNLDRDLLEERARSVLGVVREGILSF